MNKDSKFQQILSSQKKDESESSNRISSSQFFPLFNEVNKQKSNNSAQNQMIQQQRPFKANVGSQKSLIQFPSQIQQIAQTTQRYGSESQKGNLLHKHRNISSPHNNSIYVKKKTNNNNLSQQQMQSTQTGLTFKSLENIPQSSQNLIQFNHQITNISFKNHTPQKPIVQISQQLSQHEKQLKKTEGMTQISDSYLMGDQDIKQDISFHIQEALNSLKVEYVIKLYESKCKDIKLDVQFPQLLKFVDRVQKSCINGKLDLSEQALGKNSAYIIAQIIFENQNFSEINLFRNNIKDEGALVIAQAILNNPNICIINVANNNLSQLGCQYFFELVQASETIYALNISSPESYNRNKMNLQTAKRIQSMLQYNQTLAFLNISYSQLGPQGLFITKEKFSFDQKYIVTLEFLSLPSLINEDLRKELIILFKKGLHKIVKGLKENKGLVCLDISYNDLGYDCGMLLTPILMSCKLIELNLSNNKIGNESLDKIGEVVRSGQGVFSIERLDLSFNQITSEGFCDFMNMIMRNNKIIKLIFDGNSLQDPLNDSLTNFFIANTSLRYFSVRDCSFHSSFVENIAQGIQHNEALKVLDISHNYIGDEGVRHLAESLCRENRYLEELYMKRCNIQEIGGVEIAKIIVSHPRLCKIDVSHNLMSENSGTFITTNIRSNWNIIFFDIEKNYIRYDQHVEIKKLVKRNQEFQKMKEPVKLLNKLGYLKNQEVRKEDLDKRKNDIIYKGHLNKQEGQLLELNIEHAEKALFSTEEVVKVQNQEIRNEMDIIMRELKEQDIIQNSQIKDIQNDIDKQFENNQNAKKQTEQMKKEIKNRTQEMIQRRNLLIGQVAFQKRIVKDEELKAKSEEMAFQMFQQNVDNLRKKIEILKSGKLPEQSLGYSRTLSTPNSPQAGRQNIISFPQGSIQKNIDNKSSTFKKDIKKAASSINLKIHKKNKKK